MLLTTTTSSDWILMVQAVTPTEVLKDHNMMVKPPWKVSEASDCLKFILLTYVIYRLGGRTGMLKAEPVES